MRVDPLELARERRQRGEPFVLATVVWRRAPSSGKLGSKALIASDGTVRGWIGGACAEPAVVQESMRALRDGSSRLMFLGPPEELEARKRDGILAVPIACQSEGALEVYLEPMMPTPELVAIGRSPSAETLAAMARALGWRTVAVDEGGTPEDHPEADLVVGTLDLEAAGVSSRSLVVVATQGHYDELALERALAADPAYIGLVASRPRAESVSGYLRDRGVAEDKLRRVHAPAGLDLGPVAPDEIAVAILAEIVQLRAAGELRPEAMGELSPEAAGTTERAVDPVCGMVVDPSSSPHRAEHDGRTYHFCSAGCQQAFGADPGAYVAEQRA